MSEAKTIIDPEIAVIIQIAASLSREDQINFNIRLAGEKLDFISKEFSDNSQIPDMTGFLARITYHYYLHRKAFDSLERLSPERDLAIALWGFVDGTTTADEFLEYHDQIWEVIQRVGNPVARKELAKLFRFYDMDWAALSAQDITTAQI